MRKGRGIIETKIKFANWTKNALQEHEMWRKKSGIPYTDSGGRRDGLGYMTRIIVPKAEETVYGRIAGKN